MKNETSESKQKSAGFLRLLQIAGTKKWWLFGSMFLALVATVAQFVPTITIYLIIKELAAHAADLASVDRDLLYRLAFISLGSVAAFGILLYCSSMLSHIAAFNILYRLRVTVAEKLTRLSMGYFSRTTSGKIKKIMGEDVERIELYVAHHIPDITAAVLFPLLVVIFLFVMDWRLAIAAFIPFPLVFGLIFLWMAGGRVKKGFQEYHNALEKMNAAVVEYVRGMPIFRIFGSAGDSFRKLTESVSFYNTWSQKMNKDYSNTYPAFLTAASSSLVFIVPVSVALLKNSPDQTQIIPVILLFAIVGSGFFFPLLKLMFMAGMLQQINIGVDRIDSILNHEEMKEHDKGVNPEDNSIVFNKVCFTYDKVEVLNEVSFRAEPGEITALVGPSGAGKSTIGLLAARFWDVNSGRILIGGIDIREMSSERLMNHVSFVFQDTFLFFDTIEENIRMGNSAATKEEVFAAAKAAQCHEFIERLPQGYRTMVGEGGTYLSGGEQQRVAIARAILKNAPIVILDEATAYADPENEGKILKGLSQLIKGKTVLIIAHRLSTIKTADKILVVNDGHIAETGTHETLNAKNGLYSSMWEIYSRAREWKINPEILS